MTVTLLISYLKYDSGGPVGLNYLLRIIVLINAEAWNRQKPDVKGGVVRRGVFLLKRSSTGLIRLLIFTLDADAVESLMYDPSKLLNSNHRSTLESWQNATVRLQGRVNRFAAEFDVFG